MHRRLQSLLATGGAQQLQEKKPVKDFFVMSDQDMEVDSPPKDPEADSSPKDSDANTSSMEVSETPPSTEVRTPFVSRRKKPVKLNFLFFRKRQT